MRDLIIGVQVRLRPLADGDLRTRAKWTADPELCALMGADPAEEPFVSFEDELRGNQEWLRERHRSGAFVCAIEAAGQYIGDIDVVADPARGIAEISLFIGDRAQWGKGYGTETVQLALSELFNDPRIRTVEVGVSPGNERALRFWKKCGFMDHATDENGMRLLRFGKPSLPA